MGRTRDGWCTAEQLARPAGTLVSAAGDAILEMVCMLLQIHEKTQDEKDEIKRLIDRQVCLDGWML